MKIPACISHLSLPITALGQQRCELLKILLVNFIEPVQHGAVDIDDCHQLLVLTARLVDQDRHHDLALAISITCDVSRELVHVVDELRLLGLGGGTAHTSSKGDGLAGNFPLEGA